MASSLASAVRADLVERIRAMLADALGLAPERAAALNEDSALFGALPELDSMAVASLLAEIEDRFGIVIDAEEVDGTWLTRFGALMDFVESKGGR